MPQLLEVTANTTAIRLEATDVALQALASQIVVEIHENGIMTAFSAEPIELTVEATVSAPVVTSAEVQVVTVAEQGPTGPPGTSGTVEVDESLISLEWGTPSAETANAIDITGSIKTLAGAALASSVVDVQVIVSDGATDCEPSATATLSAAGTPVGTVLAGSGTATLTIRSNAGSLSIRASETAAAHRYLWLRNGGNQRLWVRSLTGVKELIFA